MDALEALLTRKSIAKLSEPGPSKSDLKSIMQAAMRAPDHACLRPWRFVVFQDKMREELGEIFCEALTRKDASATAAALEKEKKKPLRAPLVIAVIAKVSEHPKVPSIEQILSAGAAAQNIMLAVHALGFGGIWRTGAPCFDAHVRARLGAVGSDEIVGFLYIGTPISVPPMPEFDPSNYIMEWKAAEK
ncbi:hypothetical protein A9Q83_06825 [Alphaproteobacteria bacterium 46_93_T64]|nr:hypothetical protein A9Q83_06825 [Alphaproteobacteria bacterium 46_93_T64]